MAKSGAGKAGKMPFEQAAIGVPGAVSAWQESAGNQLKFTPIYTLKLGFTCAYRRYLLGTQTTHSGVLLRGAKGGKERHPPMHGGHLSEGEQHEYQQHIRQ